MLPINKTNDGNPLLPSLRERVALVTGGSRGIGRAIALRLARLGVSVAICGRDRNALEKTAVEIKEAGVLVFSQTLDVTNSAEVPDFIKKLEASLGAVSILVNNAGVGGFGLVQDKSDADWDRVLNTNLKSVFLMSRAVIPSMIQRRSGDIINISSLAGRNTFAGGGLYCASKWGLHGLSGCMAEDLREHRIRVTLVCPGSVATEFSGRGPKDPNKTLSPEDVAHVVESIPTQNPNSFMSEVHVRTLHK